jgi:type II secretory ATPase GspE/PulE/Tfp pilus assembly ATPase PilB-like protein
MGIARGSKVWKGRGCDNCGGKGVKGRIGIYEVMKMNSELRAMVAKGAVSEEIHNAALRLNMLDLKKYAGLLLLNGDTSVEEVLQVVSVQE